MKIKIYFLLRSDNMKIYKNGELVHSNTTSQPDKLNTIVAAQYNAVKTIDDLRAWADAGKGMRFHNEDEMFDFLTQIMDNSEVSE